MRAKTNVDNGFVKAKPITNLTARVGSDKPGYIQLVVEFPEDRRRRGYKIVAKEGSYPESVTDGKVKVFYDSNDNSHSTSNWTCLVTVSNSSAYLDGTTYYFCAYPYTYRNAEKIYTETNVAKCTATPVQTKGEVIITESNIFTVPYGVSKLKMFLVGGGAGGYEEPNQTNQINQITGGGGGGGGYTKTYDKSVKEGEKYAVIIGAGGKPNCSGGKTMFGELYAEGGTTCKEGGNGGSGGGQSYGNYEQKYGSSAHGQEGGTNGSNGYEVKAYDSGDSEHNYCYTTQLSTATNVRLGQNSSTRAFGETSGTLYSGGGGGSGSGWNLNVASYQGGNGGNGGGGRGSDFPYSGYSFVAAGNGGDNTGGGGGGGISKFLNTKAGTGGSGICIVRWGYN